MSGRKHCVILGAGFTGLSCAHFIKKLRPNTRVTMIDSAKRVGGWLKSFQSPTGALHEVGPRSIRSTYNARLILNMISDLGLEDDLIIPSSAAYDRYLYVNDKLQKIEMKLWKKGPFEHTMAHYGLKHLYNNVMRELEKDPDYDETIYDFAVKQFGTEIAEVAFSAVVRGIYSGDIKELSVRSCFPDFVKALSHNSSFVLGMMTLQKKMTKNPEFEIRSAIGDQLKQKKARMFALKSGNETLPKTLATDLMNKDLFEIKLETKCVKIEHFEQMSPKFKLVLDNHDEIICDDVVSSIPATELSTLLEKSTEEVTEERTVMSYIKGLKYANVAVVNLEYPSKYVQHVPQAFGYLVPAVQESNVMGVTFDSFSFPEVPNGSSDVSRFSAMINKCNQGSSDEHYLNAAVEDCKRHLQIEVDPTFAAVNVNWRCIPQYAVGHSKQIDKLRSLFPEINFLGPIFHPPGLVDCALNAHRTAINVCRD